jgi:hypothetical protein
MSQQRYSPVSTEYAIWAFSATSCFGSMLTQGVASTNL